MKAGWIALAAAGLVAACGGGDDNGNVAANPPGTGENPPQAQAYTLAVRPHLGTVSPGSALVAIPLTSRQNAPLQTVMPAVGDAQFSIPAESCGPGLVAVVGSAQTRYFDEGSGQYETLPETESIRALVPDLCGNSVPVSVSMLDEIALHLRSQRLAELESAIRDYQSRLDRSAGVDPAREAAMEAARDAAIEAAQKVKDEAQSLLGQALGLPPAFGMTLPTPIATKNPRLSTSLPDQLAAFLQSLARTGQEIRENAVDKSTPIREAQARLIGEQIAGLFSNMAEYPRPADVFNTIIAEFNISEAPFDFGYVAGAVDAASRIGASAEQVATDLRGLIQKAMEGMTEYSPDMQGALEKSKAAAQARTPPPSEDMTMIMRAALGPALVRAEPRSRLDEAVARRAASFACSVGATSRGNVSIEFKDNDSDGSLSSADDFMLVYKDCVFQGPLSGMTLVKSGTVWIRYDPSLPVDGQTEARGHVSFLVQIGSGAGDPGDSGTRLFSLNGAWVDRMAFGTPGAVTDSVVAGAAPVVLIDDAWMNVIGNGKTWMSQGIYTRLDLTPDFGNNLTGTAALQVEGMIGNVFYRTTSPLVFQRDGRELLAASGTMTYDMENNTRAGSIRADADGKLLTALTDATGTLPQQRLAWRDLVMTYLTR